MARWSGPPPLLIVATVLGILIAAPLSRGDDEPRGVQATAVAASTTAATAATERPSSAPVVSSSAPVEVSTERPLRRVETPVDKPAEESSGAPTDEPTDVLAPPRARASGAPRRQLLGLATFNQDRSLSRRDARADAETITRRTGVTIVGWQEGERFGPVYAMLKRRGWDTLRSRVDGTAGELAVSWRRSRFELVSSRLHRVTYRTAKGRTPYADRYALRVTLRAPRTGRLISVVDTHLPSVLEGSVHRGTYRNPVSARRGRLQLEAVGSVFDRARGRWVLGAGDYGFGAHAEIDEQPMGGMSRVLAGRALSTYAVLGTAGVDPTDTVTARYADYVHVRRTDLDAGRVRMIGQRSLGAMKSDHRPLLAWLALY